MKFVFAGVGLFLAFFFFQFRYLSPDAGVPARSTDYATHISIEQHLKEGLLFPELEKSEKGLHAVSKYLPVYHGLLGFHLSAWLLETMGIPLPGAYLLLMDLSLFIYLLFFWSILFRDRAHRRWEQLLAVGTIGTVFISNFAWAVEAAFFAQIMSYALVIVSFHFWSRKKNALAIFFLFFAVLTYPDFLIWVLPVLVFGSVLKGHKLIRVVLGLLWSLLIYTLFIRRSLLGPEVVSLYPLVFLPFFTMFFLKDLWRERPVFLHFLISYTVVTIVFLLVTQKNFLWSYYALKLVYPASFFMIYLFAKLRCLNTIRGRFLVALYLFFFMSFSNLNFHAVQNYFGKSTIFDNKFWTSVIDTRHAVDSLGGICSPTSTLVLSGASSVKNENQTLELWIRNSIFLNSDISSVEFKNDTFKKVFGDFNGFARSYQDTDRQFLETISKVGKSNHDICIVSDSTKRSLFDGTSCFEILREQGGQIYAKCKVQAEF